MNIQFVPVEPVQDGTEADGVTPKIHLWTMNVAPDIGDVRPNVIFEYAIGNRAIKTYNKLLTRETLCNQAVSLPTADDADVRTSKDDASIAAIGLFEEVVTGDFVAPGLRQAYADANVDLRKFPQQIFDFEPTPVNSPVYGVDYFLGDSVTARVLINGIERFNATVRVHSVTITIDDAGTVTTVPNLRATT